MKESKKASSLKPKLAVFSGKLQPPKDSTLKVLNEYSDSYKKALNTSEERSKSSTRKWGANPLPGEPAWDKNFDKIVR